MVRDTHDRRIPLQHQIASYPEIAAEDWFDQEDGWKAGFQKWRQVFGYASQAASHLPQRLSSSQLSSLLLLMEWWEAESEDAAFLGRLKKTLEDHADSPHQDEYIPESLKLDKLGDYHESMFHLWYCEFVDHGSQTNIQLRRTEGALQGACQRVAYLTAQKLLGTSVASESEGTRQSLPLLRETCPDMNLRLTAVGEPCPWIPLSKKHGLPYFLFDIESKKTVVVADLPHPPSYTVISHTWGRWRIEGSDMMISGIPWKVPRNTRFDIEALPDMLRKNLGAFHPTRYVWFDLFCIPQEMSPTSKWASVAKTEIARQAAIFGAAYQGFVWLNSVKDFTGLRSTVQWLALAYLQKTARDRYPVDDLFTRLEAEMPGSTSLNRDFALGTDYTSAEFVDSRPCGWFTSLWTLQESCLRPDMLLMNIDFDVFRLHDTASSLPLSIDTILALAWKVDYYNIPHPPQAVSELLDVLHRSSLVQILTDSPLGILMTGERRECTSRRAEAIMSVIGATDWYLEEGEGDSGASSSKRVWPSLVIKKYPIGFLREIHQLQGAFFFATLCCDAPPYWDMYDGAESRGPQVAGTLLPFTADISTSKIPFSCGGLGGHSSTASWTLSDDGKVLIPQACIVASTDPTLDIATTSPEFVAQLAQVDATNPRQYVVENGLPFGPDRSVSQYLAKDLAFLPGHKHAVLILSDDEEYDHGFGAVLVQVPGLENTYAKFSDFFWLDVVQGDDLAVRSVQWEVL